MSTRPQNKPGDRPRPERPPRSRRGWRLVAGVAGCAAVIAAGAVLMLAPDRVRAVLGLDGGHAAAGHVVRSFPDPANPDAAARAALYAALAEMPSELDPADPAKVAEGGRLYATQCAACHGPDLGGAPDWDWRTPRPSGRMAAPPHDATGHTWHHPDQHLFALTALGPGPFAPPGYQSDMPGFRDRLSDSQIWAILSFIKSRWPVPVREAHDRLSAGMAR